MNFQQFTQLKERVESLQRESDRSAGARSQLLLRLKVEFGCTTIKQAKRLLAELEQGVEVEDRRFQKALNEFNSQYPSP